MTEDKNAKNKELIENFNSKVDCDSLNLVVWICRLPKLLLCAILILYTLIKYRKGYAV